MKRTITITAMMGTYRPDIQRDYDHTLRLFILHGKHWRTYRPDQQRDYDPRVFGADMSKNCVRTYRPDQQRDYATSC